MEPDEKKRQIHVWYVLAALVLLLAFQVLRATYEEVEQIPYSRFEQLLAEDGISEIVVGESRIEGTLKTPTADGKRRFVTLRVDPVLAEKLAGSDVTVTGAPSAGLLGTMLAWLLPIALFYLIWMFAIRRIADRQGFGGLMTIGKSRAKVYVESDTKVSFADVAGVDGAKAERRRVLRHECCDGHRPSRRAGGQRPERSGGGRTPAGTSSRAITAPRADVTIPVFECTARRALIGATASSGVEM